MQLIPKKALRRGELEDMREAYATASAQGLLLTATNAPQLTYISSQSAANYYNAGDITNTTGSKL